LKVPLLNLKAQYSEIQDELETAVLNVLRSGFYILGPLVKDFEEKSAEYLGSKYAIGCANGSDALYIALLALGIQPGDEVITTPFTYIATAEAISQIGAIPVFVDIEENTFNINPSLIEKKINSKTKAIMLVHLFGQCCKMNEIMQIAEKHNLKIIEDSAQAFGATCIYKGETRSAGSIGDIGTFSFYPTKNLSCAGDGGLITCNNGDLNEKIRRIRIHGTTERYYHCELGVNSRLDEIQAAVLLVKLKYIDAWNTRRAEIAKKYDEAFKDLDWIVCPKTLAGNKHIFHQYTIRIAPKAKINRNELRSRLLEQGIASEIYYPLALHLQEVYKFLNLKAEDLPVANQSANTVLSLPIYPELSDGDIDLVIKALKSSILEPAQ
jgi:dTDP-4-amino-4,6-dideoxygalactose transaminase